MNSVERVMAALDNKQPDRVPIMELTIDPKVIEALYPGDDIFDFVEDMELDVVPFGITTDDRPKEWVDPENRIFRDRWGGLQRMTTEVLPIMCEPPRIETDRDLAEYEPPDGNDEYFIKQAREVVKRFKSEKAICFVGEAVFAPQQYLRAGLENLMIDFATRPEFVQTLAQVGVDYHVELYRRLIDEGVEIVLLGDDYAWKQGPFMSPEHFERYILPGFSTVVEEIKQAGGRVIKHSDGYLWKILDSIVGTGIDALGPLEPLPGMELDRIKSHYDNSVCVVGNVEVDLLCRGSVEDVVAATRHLLKTASVGGGHILSSGNSIISAVNPDNYRAMVETALAEGQYN
ncbi:MAG: uroporphyrinogen decarboxylase family protein [Armatimonadota bacterium]